MGTLSAPVAVVLEPEECAVITAALALMLAGRWAETPDETIRLMRSALLKVELGLRERLTQ